MITSLRECFYCMAVVYFKRVNVVVNINYQSIIVNIIAHLNLEMFTTTYKILYHITKSIQIQLCLS